MLLFYIMTTTEQVFFIHLFKNVSHSEISQKSPLSQQKGRLCSPDEQWLNLINHQIQRREMAALSRSTDSRWTKVHMNYAWSNLKKLYKKFNL